MWYFTSETNNRILYVVPNQEITIGRSVDAQVCNFAIPEDASISRKHATLSVSDNNLYLEDHGSRYGTFINNMADVTDKIETKVKIKLNNNDVVRFGKLHSSWKVHEIKFITCTSTLQAENLETLNQCLNYLGGSLKSEWDDSCTYLTMPAIRLTIKVLLSLTQGAHIVTPEFWKKCVEAVKNHKTLPEPANFIPQVVESTLNKENISFLPNVERRSLFAGKNIIFFSRRQLEMYKLVLTKCSANPLLLSETKMTKSSLCEENVIVIQYNIPTMSQETQAQRTQINDIINYLKGKGKRVIAESEIGLAILFCSIDMYCNPDSNFPTEVIKQNPGQDSKQTKVLAQESQEPTQKLGNDNMVINESLTPLSSKRKLNEDDDFEMNANKKFAAQLPASTTSCNESVKRKHSDDVIGNGNHNPSKKMAVENEDDNIFNFLNNTTANANQNNTDENMLNFTKPVQKPQNTGANDEEELFNFVQDKQKETADSVNSSPVLVKKLNLIKKEMDTETPDSRKCTLNHIDISAMRGSKVNELREIQSKWTEEDFKKIVKIKKEEPDDDDAVYVGTTIVTVRNLIVKNEPIIIEEKENHNPAQKNFKKFKKVWPLYMQKSMMSIDTAEEKTSHTI